MSRKDYVAFAELINGELNHWRLEHAVEPADVLRRMAENMADVFAADNAGFDRLRFFRACGLMGS